MVKFRATRISGTEAWCSKEACSSRSSPSSAPVPVQGFRLPSNTKSAVTADKSPATYWEHIVVVTETGCEVLDFRDLYDAPCSS